MSKPQFDVSVQGAALGTEGLTQWNTYDPLGLATFGLIWSCGNIWGPTEFTGVTITTWTDYLPTGVEEC